MVTLLQNTYFIPTPTSLHVFYYYEKSLGECTKFNIVNSMSEFTLRSHGAEVGQQFSWERTCERVWERPMERALLWVVKWSIWKDCQVRLSYVSRV